MQKVFHQRIFSVKICSYLSCRYIDTESITETEKHASSLTTNHRMNMLKKNISLNTKKPYKPPSNIRHIIQDIVSSVCGPNCDWQNLKLHDREIKFKILSAAIDYFDHDIPNCVLSQDINCIDDLVEYYETEVAETSAYEDLHAKNPENLPPNLHIQLEALRFNPETDNFFAGKTAFPGRDTIVTSIKYKRKYEGTVGTKKHPGFSNHFKKY